MGAKQDLTGKRFTKLVVMRLNLSDNRKCRSWLCKCECGKEIVVKTAYLNNGHVRSCGCLAKDNHPTKHSMSNTPTYRTWDGMMQRCYNRKKISYPNYGGRGIIVCDEWHNFSNFYKDMGERPPGCTLDRIDVNESYCKENCRWANKITQDNNKQNSRKITYKDETHTISEWARILNIPRNTLDNRLTRGKWDVEKAFTKKGA